MTRICDDESEHMMDEVYEGTWECVVCGLTINDMDFDDGDDERGVE